MIQKVLRAIIIASMSIGGGMCADQFSVVDQISAIEARTYFTKLAIQSKQMDERLLRGLIISIDQDIAILNGLNRPDLVAESKFTKALALIYGHSEVQPHPTLEALDLMLESAINGYQAAQEVVEQTTGKDFELVKDQYLTGDIKKIYVFAEIMRSRMGNPTLFNVYNALLSIASMEVLTDVPLEIIGKLQGSLMMANQILSELPPDFCQLIYDDLSSELNKIRDIIDSATIDMENDDLDNVAIRFWDLISREVDVDAKIAERDMNAVAVTKLF